MNLHYYNRYYRFIDWCKLNPAPSGYTEEHHILPKSMGGSSSEDNLIRLTARQHFIAHWMLWKAYSTFGMAKAFYLMSVVNVKHSGRKNKINSRTFESLRKFKSEAQKQINRDRWLDPEWAAKQRLVLKKAASTPKERARRSENAFAVNLKYREQRSESHKQRWQDPEWAQFVRSRMIENSPKTKSIIVDGIEYKKAEEVALKYNITKTAVRYRINSTSSKFSGWKYK